MATPTTIPLDAVPQVLRNEVLEAFRRYAMREEYRMSYEEAAWLYGYRPDTLRRAKCKGQLLARKSGSAGCCRVSITHRSMRNYIRTRKPQGGKRKALKEAQMKIS
mgnify:CR=1 FL=1